MEREIISTKENVDFYDNNLFLLYKIHLRLLKLSAG